MTVRLPPEIERIVNDAVLSGQYRSAEDVLTDAISVWQGVYEIKVGATGCERPQSLRSGRRGCNSAGR